MRHAAQGHDPRADGVQIRCIERQGFVRADRAVSQYLQRVVLAAVVGAGHNRQRTAQPALGGVEQALALEREDGAIAVRLGRRQSQDEGLAVLRQDRQRIVELGRRRRLDQEFAEAGLIVLGIGADHLGRGQNRLDLQGAADLRVGDCGVHPQMARAVRQRRQLPGSGGHVRTQFDPEGAGHQRILGGQQGIDAGRQTLNADGNDDLLAHAWLGVAVDGRRRDRRAIGRHNGVDLVVGVAQTRERRVHIGQRSLQHIDRPAATRDEARARRRAAARQVQHRAFVRPQ
ncbi:hypothetical protein D3C80_469290 [compost metagenome]